MTHSVQGSSLYWRQFVRGMVSQIRKFGTNAKFTRGILAFSLLLLNYLDSLAEKIDVHQCPQYFFRAGTI